MKGNKKRNTHDAVFAQVLVAFVHLILAAQ
jgi:hypothetical protein